ncbi:phosphotransferase enzyme family protein [Deinococcus radiodurans]|uniref:phosphotransferase enzyme family protein n=1 Tax=Deinococcus radiodurans TaxID=1299 RepID=UPI0002E1E131|nr:phosphotransferase enzyme family protein [Deinococcus radiodurans]ANC72354.1 hypothetical protein A2G07_11565 [Deinococcus radiodurans R1 = ATCC 13939 = DSM 20539]QIP28581.1 phosphotransferase enzyme family protein [Deinococcus radiodurans]QIP32708.1 phosphotransferase enzyme family protein [Deinococcus radiodurans]UID69399.1 hypothetical protein DRO_0394 [Deinococcus radiodurans R1 = ATCC 13939 = DSM 20539]UTA49984.1 phosphotransferase enzyme family protein [Deinococcus radiodurans]
MSFSARSFPALHSVLAPTALAGLVSETYGLTQPALTLLRRGLNDTSRVQSGERRTILRVYRCGWRTPAEVGWELAFLQHLAGRGVRVSSPLPRADGALFGVLDAAEGPRAYAMFEYLPGRALENTPADAALYGQCAAGLHDAADPFTAPGRLALDLNHLLTEPLRQMRPLLTEFPDLAAPLEAAAERTQARLTALAPGLSWGACHGDLHEANARLTPENEVGLFDFDCAGPGFRAYDLAVYWWSQVTQGQGAEEVQPLWDAFLGAYRERRPLTDADLAALPHFVAARALWFMGLMAGRAAEFGTETLGRPFFEFGLNFLTEWEERHGA